MARAAVSGIRESQSGCQACTGIWSIFAVQQLAAANPRGLGHVLASDIEWGTRKGRKDKSGAAELLRLAAPIRGEPWRTGPWQ